MADQTVAVPVPSKAPTTITTEVIEKTKKLESKLVTAADADLKDAVHAAETIATGWWQKIKTKAAAFWKAHPIGVMATFAAAIAFCLVVALIPNVPDRAPEIAATNAAVSSLAANVSKLAAATPSRSDVAEANARIDDLKNQVATLKDQVEKLAKAPSRLSKTKQRR
ncbi:hypothetical protein [Hyphomicrobium sp. DY-1]|uniref:hypothetical protein n=1 Tax=Hyphomicrobium sp. DY-1 TaxID=3075650 RepID=UPI0039C17026